MDVYAEKTNDNMHFDRDKLEEEVLEKVKEVNEESGYRPYFELPEYVHIVATIMEEKFKVGYDDLVNQIHLLSKELDKAQIKAETLEEELHSLRETYANPYTFAGKRRL